MRIALGVEYDGSKYHGWQKQPRLITIQDKLEIALSTVADHDITISCAGRTDTGVHAMSQVIHFDTFAQRNLRSWLLGANHTLAHDISVIWAKEVNENFHARFTAIARRYRYYIYNSPIRSALMRQNITWHYRYLEVDLMQQAAQYLIGEHDFTSYRALQCQSKSPNRNVHHINISRKQDIVCVDIQADAFLHHMVRNIIGVLLEVGSRKKAPIWAQEVLHAKDRRVAGVTAPAYGLYLTNVYYPENFEIPEGRSLPFFEIL